MKVAVIGTGHVGLVTAATMASVGHEVVGVDLDPAKLELMRSGKSWFFEPGLEELMGSTMAEERLGFTNDTRTAVQDAEVIFICVGTPARANGEANLVAVEGAARDVAKHARRGAVLVEKSTVPAGTAARIKQVINRERPDIASELYVASNPEFLREGRAVQDSLEPDRILIGAMDTPAFEIMRQVYAPFLKNGAPLIETTVETSELSKHAANAFLALKISYANALARICERAGADVEDVVEVMGADRRIGREFLNAGLGWGGYCFPKDVIAFERLAQNLGYEFPLLGEIARINDEAVTTTVDKIREAMWNLEGKTIALLGLSFKANTDDTRFSPSLALAQQLIDAGANVVGYDPEASDAGDIVPDMTIAKDAYEAVEGAHCMVIGTDWDEFKALDLHRVRELLVYPIVVDGRNLFDHADMLVAGLTYIPTGRPAVHQPAGTSSEKSLA
jgi:UDPglucose 6-dehydrogenase